MARFFHHLKNARNLIYTRFLGITNVCTTCGLLCVGDVLTQSLEIGYYKYKNPGVKNSEGHETEIDYNRTGRIFQVGIPYGILSHVWYQNLDKWFPGRTKTIIFKKVLVDTVVAGPVFILLYFYGMALTEKKGLQGSWQAVKDVFVPVYTVDVCYWPVAQAANFYLVPNRYRILVISLCALFWNTFLSFVQHLENESKKSSPRPSTEQHHSHDDILAHPELKARKDSEPHRKEKTRIVRTETTLDAIKQKATVSASSSK